MNFNIIEGNNDYLIKTEAFAKEYNQNKLSVPKICEKLDINLNEYRKLRRHCIEENLIRLKRQGRPRKQTYKTHPRNYSRVIRGKYTYFRIYKNGVDYGICKTEEQAQEIVRRLKKVNWDKKYLQRIREDVL